MCPSKHDAHRMKEFTAFCARLVLNRIHDLLEMVGGHCPITLRRLLNLAGKRVYDLLPDVRAQKLAVILGLDSSCGIVVENRGGALRQLVKSVYVRSKQFDELLHPS